MIRVVGGVGGVGVGVGGVGVGVGVGGVGGVTNVLTTHASSINNNPAMMSFMFKSHCPPLGVLIHPHDALRML